MYVIADASNNKKKIGRLTPANLSRELSSDVSYPQNIYHWLNKQNNQTFTPRYVSEVYMCPLSLISL